MCDSATAYKQDRNLDVLFCIVSIFSLCLDHSRSAFQETTLYEKATQTSAVEKRKQTELRPETENREQTS